MAFRVNFGCQTTHKITQHVELTDLEITECLNINQPTKMPKEAEAITCGVIDSGPRAAGFNFNSRCGINVIAYAYYP